MPSKGVANGDRAALDEDPIDFGASNLCLCAGDEGAMRRTDRLKGVARLIEVTATIAALFDLTLATAIAVFVVSIIALLAEVFVEETVATGLDEAALRATVARSSIPIVTGLQEVDAAVSTALNETGVIATIPKLSVAIITRLGRIEDSVPALDLTQL